MGYGNPTAADGVWPSLPALMKRANYRRTRLAAKLGERCRAITAAGCGWARLFLNLPAKPPAVMAMGLCGAVLGGKRTDFGPPAI